MRKFSFLLALGLFLALSTGIYTHGSCVTSYLVRHNSSSGRAVSTDTHPGVGFDVNTATNPFGAYFWQYGAGDTVNGGTCTGTQNQVRLIGGSPNRFVLYNMGGDWVNACTNGCPGNPPTGTRTAAVIWQNVGEGTTGHKLLWVAYSVMYNTTLGRFDFSTITNGPLTNNGVIPNNMELWGECYDLVDVYYCAMSRGSADYYWDMWLYLSPLSGGGTNGDMGYYDTVPTGLPLIQDYEIYYQAKPTYDPPTSGDLAGWTMYPTRAPGNTTSIYLTDIYAESGYLYFAIRPRFGLGNGSVFAPPFVGANSPYIPVPTVFCDPGAYVLPSSNVCTGQSVQVGGSCNNIWNEPLQWMENGVDIPGATGNQYNVQKNSPGTFWYSIECNDRYRCFNQSAGVQVTWSDPPAVDITPNGTSTATVNSSITFTAVASGGKPPYWYYWKRDGVNISGATNSTLTETYSSAQSHIYNCQVNTWNGCTTSALDSSPSTGTWQEAAAIEVQNQHWTDVEAMAWDAVGGATGYRLQRGQVGDLPNLLNASNDSCRAYEGADTSISTLDEDPSTLPPGDFYWYIVLSLVGATEGSAGSATAGPRILNSSGWCP